MSLASTHEGFGTGAVPAATRGMPLRMIRIKSEAIAIAGTETKAGSEGRKQKAGSESAEPSIKCCPKRCSTKTPDRTLFL
jgi:hypothetical protein